MSQHGELFEKRIPRSRSDHLGDCRYCYPHSGGRAARRVLDEDTHRLRQDDGREGAQTGSRSGTRTHALLGYTATCLSASSETFGGVPSAPEDSLGPFARTLRNPVNVV